MNITVSSLPLKLHRPFRLSYGSTDKRENALIRIGEACGEAALPPYYPSRLRDIQLYVDALDIQLGTNEIPPVRSMVQKLPPGPAPARAAVDMALHDLWGRRLGQPLYRLFGLDPAEAPPSTVTISIPGSLELLSERIAPYSEAPQLKLKLGSGDLDFDLALVRKASDLFSGQLCVDVNGGWTIDESVRAIDALSELDLMFIEQPIGSGHSDDWHLLRRLLPPNIPPLIADESHQTSEDIIELAGAADGVNIKLAKCGGLQEALSAIDVARSIDMTVMIGCMIESNIALSAAAHIASQADYLDLDGMLHLAHDPYEGLKMDNGRLILSDDPGLGVRASQK